MRDLDARGAEGERQFHHRFDARDIGAMHHHVDGERQAELHDFRRKRALARRGAVIAGYMIGGFLLAVLDRDLHVIETGIGQRIQDLRRQTDRRGDQITVETGLARALDDIGEVAPRRRLAAREMHLQHAEGRRFAEHAGPGGAVELVGARVERERVRAIGTPQGTAMRKLGEQAERIGQVVRRQHG